MSINISHCCHIFCEVVCLRWLYHHMLLVSYTHTHTRTHTRTRTRTRARARARARTRTHTHTYICIYLFLLLMCSLKMCANNRIHDGLVVVFVCLHLHHHADVSDGIAKIAKILVRCILSSVSLRSSQFSQLSFMHYIGLCVFSLPEHGFMMLSISVLIISHAYFSLAW